MQKMITFLADTWLNPRYRYPAPRDPHGGIQGSTEEEIIQAEAQINRRIPAALKAWYRVAGEAPPHFFNFDADYSLANLIRTQEIASQITQWPECEWQLSETMLPFSSYQWASFDMVDWTDGNPEDPPVYTYIESEPQPQMVSPAFTVFMRQRWLSILDDAARPRLLAPSRVTYHPPLRGRAASYEEIQDHDAANRLILERRQQLTARVYQQDLQCGEITGPREFQQLWQEEFTNSGLRALLAEANITPIFDWVDPPSSRQD